MALTGSFGYTDTVSAKRSIEIPNLSISTDFALKSESKDDVWYTNTTTPIDQPELLRYGYSRIKDVYAGTDISPSYYATSKAGSSIVIQVADIYRVKDNSTESSCCNPVTIDLPITSHIVIKAPLSQYITAEVVLQQLYRTFAACFENGDTTGTKRINDLLRGALKP